MGNVTAFHQLSDTVSTELPTRCQMISVSVATTVRQLLKLMDDMSKFAVSPGAVGLDLDPTDKVFFFADSGSPGSPN